MSVRTNHRNYSTKLSTPKILLKNNTHQGGHAFGNLKGEASASFNSMGMEITYSRGASVFAEGQLPQCVFVVHSGRIKLSVTSREGKTMILRIAERGEVLGLSAALTASENEISAEALEPCRVTAIRVKDFLEFLEKYPDAAMQATHCILQEYQAVFSDICRLALPATVAGRLANLLLGWLKSRCPGEVEPRFIMTLTQEEIAGMTGTSRETVSRVLQQFQRENLISIKGSSLTVLRREALEQLAA